MSTISEIKLAIQKLSLEEAQVLQDWLTDYLGANKAVAWKRLAGETQALPVAQRISDDDIAAEIAAYRAGDCAEK